MHAVTLKISLMETSLIYAPYLAILHPKEPISPFEVTKTIPTSEVRNPMTSTPK